jgi:glycosyltransferase involved in cell wall biosynthesis
MRRVVQVDTATEWRGGQVQTRLLVEGLIAHGWPAAVACPPKSALWRSLKNLPCERIAIPPGRTLRGLLTLSQTPADLFAAQTAHAHSLCALLKRPLVVHRRVDFVPSGGWKYRRPEQYIAVSAAVADILAAAGARSVAIVHDGVRPLPAASPATDGPPVLAVGARVAHKGHRVLAAAASLLPGVDIGVAGSGPLVYPGLRWLGQRDDISALLAAARVFVHPSVEEGMGQAVVEAMLAGVPVVTSDAGGLPEVVGDTGIVVPRNNPAALAAGIRAALAGDHPPVEAARRRAEELFSVANMVKQTLATYANI